MEGWTISKVISEVINGVLVFRPDDLTPEEYAEWRVEAVAYTNLFWESLAIKHRNKPNGCWLLRKLRYGWRYMRNRLR